jgi:hypothetical protein
VPPAPERPRFGPPDPETAATEARALVARAIEGLRDARDSLDEAAEFTSLPVDLAAPLSAFESAVGALRRLLIRYVDGELTREGRSLPDTGEDVVHAMQDLLAPSAEWTESMAKRQRHLSDRPPHDDAATR